MDEGECPPGRVLNRDHEAHAVRPAAGTVVDGVGWFDVDQLGIDQGPIVAMIENSRSELIWRVMRRNPYVVAGLRRAGFTGGWLDTAGPPQ